MLQIKRTDSTDPDFQFLVTQLNEYLQQQYGSLQDFYSQFNHTDNIRYVVLVYYNNEPAGCGCFKAFAEDAVEVKRMFVSDSFRGRKIGMTVLAELENWARELGHRRMVLEMGNRQPEAAGLYPKMGFSVIPNYGQYVGMEETSICMEKILG